MNQLAKLWMDSPKCRLALGSKLPNFKVYYLRDINEIESFENEIVSASRKARNNFMVLCLVRNKNTTSQ